MDNLENVLESILFVSGDAVDINDIVGKIDATKPEIKNAVKKLKNKYKESSGIVLLEFNNKLQFASASQYADAVAQVLNPIRQRNLSKATLETASIIAYKQPVTRLEIEEIRGVSSDYAINILLEHNLIEIVGRKDTVGKPVLFGTTDEFLKRFNISSIDDLPDYNELLEKVKVIHTDNRLYNHFEIKESDEEMEKKLGLGGLDVALAVNNENLEELKEKTLGEKSDDESTTVEFEEKLEITVPKETKESEDSLLGENFDNDDNFENDTNEDFDSDDDNFDDDDFGSDDFV